MKRHNDQHLKDVLKEMVETYRLRSKLNQTKIKLLWTELMGPSIGRHTTDIKIRGKKLYVSINSSSLKQELSMGKEKIQNIINEQLGEEYIQEVVIR
jgi:predicted nucleic acid-binding Zn ribbon protein